MAPCVELVDRWMTVPEADIASAMVDVLSKQSKLVEGAAAVAVACASRMAQAGELSGKTAVVVCCGGNVSFDKLQLAIKLGSR